jgi:nucleotide-binding universal stress UspA family protein
MGCIGSADEKNRFLGSNALRIMRSSSIPVITANPKSEFSTLKHIVLPIDLTKESKEKLERALLFARLNKEIIIHVLSVTFDADEYMVNRLSQQLLKVKSIIEKSKTKYTAEIIKAATGYESLGEIITDYSRKVEGDLIILMTQQEVNYTPYFVSSLAQEIINISEVPVMTVAPGNALN